LTVESLMVLLAQHLFAQREVVPFRHFKSFEGLDQLHGILAPAKARLLHAELECVHGLEVRVDEAVWRGARWINLFEARRGIFEKLPVRGCVEWAIEYRQIAVDAGKTLDLIAERPQVGRLDDAAIACPFVLLGEAEIEGLIA